MLLIVSIIITAELYSTFKYHMKIGETTRCCSFFLKTHVKISSKISIIEFNIQIKWCIIVTPSREAEKDYQGYFNSPPHKKNHIATTMINTVFFKISTHILTKRMTTNPTITFKAGTFQLTSSRRGWPGRCMAISNVLLFQLTSSRRGWQHSNSLFYPSNIFQLTSSRRGWPVVVQFHSRLRYFNSHPHEEDDLPGHWIGVAFHISTHILTKRMTNIWECLCYTDTFQLTSSRRGWRKRYRRYQKYKKISTHILTKRMTPNHLSSKMSD